MKTCFRIREIALVSTPFVLLLGFALYWTRVEAVSALGGSRMFISKVELTAASGRSASEGTSHYLTVTIEHPWPRPKWWGHGQPANSEVDALASTQKPFKPRHALGERPGQFVYLASGGALQWMKKGRIQRYKPKKKGYGSATLIGYGSWKDGNLIFSHALPLHDLPATEEPLTFNGLYELEGQPPLRLNKVIRARGEKMQWQRNRDAGGKIVGVKATPFVTHRPINVPHYDQCNISVLVSHPPRVEVGKPNISDYDLELVDESGKAVKLDQINVTIAYPGSKPKITDTATEKRIFIEIKRTFPTRELLTFRGKISIDEHWPIPFSVRLPPR